MIEVPGGAPVEIETGATWAQASQTISAGGRYRPDIDGLRAIAVLAVLCFHGFPKILPGGFIGVDIFFVISGYLITGILLDDIAADRFSFARFYARRIRRIFPALIVVLGACLVAGWVYLLPEEYQQLGFHTAAGTGFLSNFLLWNEAGYFDRMAESKPLLHLWSLGIEEQFYLAWPLAVWLAARRPRALALLCALVICLSFGANLLLVCNDPVAAFYSPLSRFWELIAGAALADWVRRRPAPWHDTPAWSQLLSVAGILLIASGLVKIRAGPDFPGLWALLPVLGAASLISAGPRAWGNRLLGGRLLARLGRISYPLYLWHWPLLVFARTLNEGALDGQTTIAALLASLVLALMTYLCVEYPLRFKLPVRAAVVGLCLTMAALSLAALCIYQFEGVPTRLPTQTGGMVFAGEGSVAWKVNVREGACFLFSGRLRSPICMEAQRPLVFLWGDSHAAALYPGLRQLQQTRAFGIAQFTTASCPPLLEFTTPARRVCPEMNLEAIDAIAAARPMTVVLDAFWRDEDYSLYDPAARHFDAARLLPTLLRLRALGVTNIVLVGPAPIWNDSLDKILFMHFMRDPLHRVPPLYLRKPLTDGLWEIDAALRDFAAREGLRYLSPVDAFCKQEGCLTRLGAGGASITAVDYGHLSEAASNHLAQLWAADILGK